MKKPIDMIMDGLEWKPIELDAGGTFPSGVPYATHEGVMEIAGKRLRCYRLNTGQAIIHAGDMKEFFDNDPMVEELLSGKEIEFNP